ncbi:MAG: hypothetical protein R3F14_46385 [Polyangiaceae bacterium]
MAKSLQAALLWLLMSCAACSGACDGGAKSGGPPPAHGTSSPHEPLSPSDHVKSTMTFADANWADTVAAGQWAILVATIEEVAPGPPPEEEQIGGTLRLSVARDLTKPRWEGPPSVLVGYAQYASEILRARLGGQGWNAMDLKPGQMVLVAVPPVPKTTAEVVGPLGAVSVEKLASAADPFVAGVEGALAIEEEKDTAKRVDLLRAGAKSNLPFLPGYSHYAMGRLHRIPRKEAVALELSLLSDAGSAVRAQSTLERELWLDETPADPLNKQILGAFFGLLAGPDEALAKSTLTGLFNMLECEDEAATDYRAEAMKDVAISDKSAILGALKKLGSDPEVGDDARAVAGVLASLK